MLQLSILYKRFPLFFSMGKQNFGMHDAYYMIYYIGRIEGRTENDRGLLFIFERMIIMTALESAVEKVINAPPRHYTKVEAQTMLRRYGVLNEDNSVTEEYRHLFIRKTDSKDENE